MLLKAGFIVAIFMHMAWERLALKLAILVPPLALLVLIGLMAIEGDYTFLTRLQSFVQQVQKPGGITAGTQPSSRQPSIHDVCRASVLWICAFVVAGVFAVMIHSIATFRRAAGSRPQRARPRSSGRSCRSSSW